MYIVISKPKRISVALGVVHMLLSFKFKIHVLHMYLRKFNIRKWHCTYVVYVTVSSENH